MPLGTVKWFDQRKGYGFITDESGNDLFVHFSNVNPATRDQLADGQAVTFEVEAGDKGPMAVQVELAEGSTPSAQAPEPPPAPQEPAPQEPAPEPGDGGEPTTTL